MKPFNLFIPLTKVDEEQRLVYGVVAAEVIDNSGELFDYEGSKPNFQKWSLNAEMTSGGKSKGNVRAMHGKVAAGKVVDLGYDDDSKVISCCAKIVDDNEWKKVQEGVYTGFSMGGRYVSKTVEKIDNKDVTKYIGDPNEISIVDKPCIPTATFEWAKADGSTEQRHFTSVEKIDKDGPPSVEKADTGEIRMYIPTNDELSARATELAKAAGETEASWAKFMDTAREQLVAENLSKSDDEDKEKDTDDEDKEKEKSPKDEPNDTGVASEEEKAKNEAAEAEKADTAPKGLRQMWITSDGKSFEKKADARTHEESLTKGDEPSELQKALAGLKGSVESLTKVDDDEEPHELEVSAAKLNKIADFLESDEPLIKGMYGVERMSRLVREAASVQISAACEAKKEGDGSKLPEDLLSAVESLGGILIEMATEETAELLASLKTDKEDPQSVYGYSYDGSYYELAAENTGLEKSDFDNALNKAVEISNKDKSRIQKVHDHSTSMGAKCTKSNCVEVEATDDTEKAEKLDSSGDLAKMASEIMELRETLAKRDKEIEETIPLVKALQIEVDRIKAMPMPPAPRTHVLEKGDTGENQFDLTKLSPSQLADMAIRMAQQNGRSPFGQ